ncbi:arylsulfatase [Bradyrhizobium yuanmingense]|uniref:arylsulfatase n=1 Tax=Bradyrhizobium yuanmingense TaxID=108015 RepID=UPI0023B91DFC|nr:arylsulfatase [Bradyrhizobium yuanmingense]MDF0522024.1 arylsulfatase [Bradyrhizobium yuanmingense]
MTNDEFRGKIGRTLGESHAWWPPKPTAPKDAPNIVFVVLDDVGYADLGCYGSEIATPRIDALAAGGIRFSNFHVTSMCSPTRACLLTGRNAHSVGVGAIAEWSSGFPGYQGRITKRAATIAEMLAENHYGTYAIGKWHLTNLANYAAAGPHEDWPLGRGFSRWYGFLGGYTDHWHPDLHADNRPVQPPNTDGYHLTCDLIDQAISQIRDHVTSAPDRPFFQYVALGAGHWPHQVPAGFLARYHGKYDSGWDAIREQRFRKQRELGLVPNNTILPKRNPGVSAWDVLDPDVKTLCARFQEAYAGFLEHADTEIGRLVDYLAAIGKLDETAIVVISDNGASGEGGATGAVNIRKHLMHEKETPAQGLAHLDRIGSEFSFNHYPQGWAQASNTPLKWYKRNTHGGGVRAPLIVHWPTRVAARGAIARQYHHVIDIVPTFLELIGIEAPAVHRGTEQIPVQGVSMAYALKDPNTATRKTTQHYELVGDRAIWHRGWKAVTHHVKGDDFAKDRWELYNLDADFSETNDLATIEPERLRELIDLWWAEAEANGVLPLDDRDVERAFEWFKANAPRKCEFLPGMARVDRLLVPAITDRSYTIRADIEVPLGGVEGAILSCGNRLGGFALYCQHGLAVFEYVYTEAVSYILRAPLRAGSRSVLLRFDRKGKNTGELSLYVDNARMASITIPNTWSTYGITAGLTCGFAGVAVSNAYSIPFTFTGDLHRVIVELADDDSNETAQAAAAIMQQQ